MYNLQQQGSWACLDEVNRLIESVMSVTAELVQTLRQAMLSHSSYVTLEQTELRLRPSNAMILTLNPNYEGRKELPESMRALFRPIAMMVSDIGIVTQVCLFVAGYSDSVNLAGKLVTLYNLA